MRVVYIEFFSVKYKEQGGLFQGLDIWKEETYRELQGTYPVIFLSFAGIKSNNYEDAREQILQIITNLYSQNEFIMESDKLGEKDKRFFVGQEETETLLGEYKFQWAGQPADQPAG